MRATLLSGALSLVLLIGLGTLALRWAHSDGLTVNPAGIEGTYKLLYRELPDGTKQTPPDIVGLINWTNGHRNFNIYWEDAEGRPVSISYIATYQLTDREYSEKSLDHLQNDEISGTVLQYDLTGPSGTSTVSRSGNRLELDLPLYGEPHLVFEDGKMTATREGAFVDYWERVE